MTATAPGTLSRGPPDPFLLFFTTKTDMPQQPPEQTKDRVDPANSFIQSMLVIALLACLGTITMIVIELNQHYGVTFGGTLNPPAEQKPAGSVPEKSEKEAPGEQPSPSSSESSSSSSPSSSGSATD